MLDVSDTCFRNSWRKTLRMTKFAFMMKYSHVHVNFSFSGSSVDQQGSHGVKQPLELRNIRNENS